MAHETESIDGVIAQLSDIVESSKVAAGSRIGYFPALYRKMTIEVKRGIEAGSFGDGPRMERLDVIFARRYLDAFDAYRNGGETSRCWAFAFDNAGEWWPIVLQHLLLGINAHINLDLGIAAAHTVPAAQLPDLRGDFDRINEVLASLVGGVEQKLGQIWPVLRLLSPHLGRLDDAIINFSMEKARDQAWAVANRLAPLSEAEQARAIEELDGDTVKLARLIRHPGPLAGTLTRLIRLGERGSVGRIIEILE